MKCSMCNRKAEVKLRYARLSLCKEHLLSYIQGRVKKAIERYDMLRDGKNVVLGISGGKDSMTLIDVILTLKDDLDLNVLPVHIDLGLNEYSKTSRFIVEDYLNSKRLKYLIVPLTELLGLNITELSKRANRKPCSVCGTVKRYILNLVAVKLNFNSVMTGHTLDDMVGYTLKSLIQGDIDSMVKLKPKTESLNGLISRVKPLCEISEDETKLYVHFKNIPYINIECPHKPSSSLEIEGKKFLNELEDKHPSIKLSFYRKMLKIMKYFETTHDVKPLRTCENCGLPSSSNLCSFCKLIVKALGTGEPVMRIHDYVMRFKG